MLQIAFSVICLAMYSACRMASVTMVSVGFSAPPVVNWLPSEMNKLPMSWVCGYKPEVAYFECLHELKLIVDLLYEGGLAKMHSFISETAKYGDLVSGPRVINAETRARMKEVLTDIQSGQFARDWIAENEAGKKNYDAMMQADLDLPLEKVGAELRSHMAWLPFCNFLSRYALHATIF